MGLLGLTLVGDALASPASLEATAVADASRRSGSAAHRARATTAITGVTPRPVVPVPTQQGQPVTVTFTVTGAVPGGGAPTGSVTVTDGVDRTVVQVGSGAADLTLTRSGKRVLTAIYSGDASFDGSTSAGMTHDVPCPAVAVVPEALPNAQTTVGYAATLAATGGMSPYEFAVTSGALPAGVTLTGGSLAGEPMATGHYGLTVTATDADGCTGSRAYVLTVTQGVYTYRVAEGAIGPSLTSYLLVLNPNSESASVDVGFQPETGRAVGTTLKIPGHTRATVPLAAAASLLARARGPAAAATTGLGTTVTSAHGLPLVVEEVTYVDGGAPFTAGARVAVSGTESATWYFAEGSQKRVDRGSGVVEVFETYLLLANDASTSATVAVRFLPEPPRAAFTEEFSVPPRARRTIPIASHVPALSGRSFGMVVTSDVPIGATWAQYLGPSASIAAAHASPGVPAPSATWLFAEGSTRSGFETFFAVANPNPTPATVTLTYHLGEGASRGTVMTQTLEVPAESRGEVYANAAVGSSPGGADFWTCVTATAPVAVERVIYRRGSTGTWSMAHGSPGVTTPGRTWGFAEASSVGGSGSRPFSSSPTRVRPRRRRLRRRSCENAERWPWVATPSRRWGAGRSG